LVSSHLAIQPAVTEESLFAAAIAPSNSFSMMSLLAAEKQSTSRRNVAFGWRAPYGEFSRKNFRPTLVGTVTEIWPALVTADCATGDQAFGSDKLVVSARF